MAASSFCGAGILPVISQAGRLELRGKLLQLQSDAHAVRV